MRAFILAGGFATRLWPLTEKRAKPLLPLAGKPMIAHLVEKIPAEIPVTVSTNAAFEKGFRDWIATLDRPNINLVVEHTKHDGEKLGALGAVAQWVREENIDEDILLLTGDNFLGFSLEDFLAKYRSPAAILAAHDIGDLIRASAFGTVLTHPEMPHKIIGFEEKPKEAKTTLVSTGCSIIPKEVLPVLVAYAAEHPDNVGGIFEELLRKGHEVESFRFTDPWLDIGSFPSYLDAHRLLVQETIRHPEALIERSVCTGSVAIGAGSVITDSELHDTVVFERCQITNCTLRDCVVDEDCVLEGVDLHHKMLRAGTVLRLA